MSKRSLSPQDVIVRTAREFLRRRGRLITELYYHLKVHPKSGELSHLFRGKETLPHGEVKTVRFLGILNDKGSLADLDEVGSRERKRIGSRGPVAGRVKVPHRDQKIVRRDRERKRETIESSQSLASGPDRTDPTVKEAAGPASPSGQSVNPPPPADHPREPQQLQLPLQLRESGE
jgi:hypothetical protein